MSQHLEMIGLSDSTSKTRVVYVVLPIAIAWCGVDELTLETPFFFIQRNKKKQKKHSHDDNRCLLFSLFVNWSSDVISHEIRIHTCTCLTCLRIDAPSYNLSEKWVMEVNTKIKKSTKVHRVYLAPLDNLPWN